MRIDWRAVVFVVLVLAGLVWQGQIREILLTGQGLLSSGILSGIRLPPLEEELEVEPIEITLPEATPESIGEEEEELGIAGISSISDWTEEHGEEQEKFVEEREPSIVSPAEPAAKKVSLAEIEMEVHRVEREKDEIAVKVARLVEKHHRLAEMKAQLEQISREVEIISQSVAELAISASLG